jgi:enoyl-CoA hydratase/carnithine racemase
MLTLNRIEDGNMFTRTMCHEIRDCINLIRRKTRILALAAIKTAFSARYGGVGVHRNTCFLSG